MIRSLKGKTPRVDPTAFVSETAYVVGDVEIGPESVVWPGTVLRGDLSRIVLGRGNLIDENATFHTDPGVDLVMGDWVYVGHNAVVHGRKVGNNVFIGAGAVVLEGSEIGDDCVIGALTLVPRSFRVPSGSLAMGIPAQLYPLEERHIKLTQIAREMGKDFLEAYKEANLGSEFEGMMH